MSNKSTGIVQKVWSYAHVLKDDGLAFMDYTEQITYLLFLKMVWEQRGTATDDIPRRYDWQTLKNIEDKAKRLDRYHQGLRKLSEYPGLIGLIFTKPQSKISDPAKLHLLMQMIDSEHWSSLDVDVKGEVYEGLLAKNAEDVRGGAGQYFTPRPVIRAIVEVMKPEPTMRISDPACGTGGFLLGAFEYLQRNTPNALGHEYSRTPNLQGVELVPNVARLCAMNLFLHGVGINSDHAVISIGDSLETKGATVNMVLTNPPFGKKSSFTVVGRDGKNHTEKISYQRPDFLVTTSNKQLNFLQHCYSLLNEAGKAAIVIPDNVLFEGGAGERVRRFLLQQCEVHTLLRLPTGIWYSPGVKANVLFFDKPSGSRRQENEHFWVYDLRSNLNFTLRHRPIRHEDLRDFVFCYCADDRSKRQESPRFRRFNVDEILTREKANLDIQFPIGNGDQLPGENSGALMQRILEDLEEAMREFAAAQKQIRE